MASNFPDKNKSSPAKQLAFQGLKKVASATAGVLAKHQASIQFPGSDIKPAIASAGASVLAELAIEGIALGYNAYTEYEAAQALLSSEPIQEIQRRLRTSRSPEIAELNFQKSPHLRVDNGEDIYFDNDDIQIIDLENVKRTGRYGNYVLKDMLPDSEDKIPEGPTGSHFLRIKVIESSDVPKCVYLKKLYLEAPDSPMNPLIFKVKPAGDKTKTNPNISYYTEFTLFFRTETGVEECGVARILSPGGIQVMRGNKILHDLSSKTVDEDRRDIEDKARTSHREDRLSQTRQLRGKYMLEGHDLTCSLASLSFQDQKVIRTGQYMFDEQQSWKEFEKIKSIQARFAYDVKALAEKIAEINKAVEELKYECSKPRMSKIRALLHDLTVCIRSKPSKKTCNSKIRVAVDKLEDHGKEIGQLLNTARSKALDEIDNIGYKLQVLFEDTIKRTDSPQDIETIMNLRSKFQQSVNEFTGIEAELMDLSGSIDRVANDNKVPIKMKLGGVSEVRGDKKRE